MSQHDFSIANQGFPAFRSDLNDALQALVSNSSGATEPTTTYAHQMWVDTTADPSILKIRNADNDAWITLGNIDQTGDTFIYTPAAGSASAPAYSTSGDLNTGVFFPGADIVALAAGGAEKLMASTSEVVVNDGSADVDFRVESDADTHALFVEGSSGNVGIGTSSPVAKFDVRGVISIPTSGGIVIDGGASPAANTKYISNGGAYGANNSMVLNVPTGMGFEFAINSTDVANINTSGIFSCNLTQSAAANGYVKLPSGIYIQWGAGIANTSGVTNTFPIAFPNAAYVVVAVNNNQANPPAPSCQSLSTTSFVALVSAGSPSIYYIAIGR